MWLFFSCDPGQNRYDIGSRVGAAALHRATLNRAAVKRRQFTGRQLTGATIKRSDR